MVIFSSMCLKGRGQMLFSVPAEITFRSNSFTFEVLNITWAHARELWFSMLDSE